MARQPKVILEGQLFQAFMKGYHLAMETFQKSLDAYAAANGGHSKPSEYPVFSYVNKPTDGVEGLGEA